MNHHSFATSVERTDDEVRYCYRLQVWIVNGRIDQPARFPDRPTHPADCPDCH